MIGGKHVIDIKGVKEVLNPFLAGVVQVLNYYVDIRTLQTNNDNLLKSRTKKKR